MIKAWFCIACSLVVPQIGVVGHVMMEKPGSFIIPSRPGSSSLVISLCSFDILDLSLLYCWPPLNP